VVISLVLLMLCSQTSNVSIRTIDVNATAVMQR
jgi:hypothetical protein